MTVFTIYTFICTTQYLHLSDFFGCKMYTLLEFEQVNLQYTYVLSVVII